MKKKLMALFLAGAMTLSLAACGGSASSSAASSEAASSGAASSEAASSTEEPITLRIAYMPNYGVHRSQSWGVRPSRLSRTQPPTAQAS